MTDYRRTEEEIWDEDVAEEDRQTNVLPLFAVAGRPPDSPVVPSVEVAPEGQGAHPSAGASEASGEVEPPSPERSSVKEVRAVTRSRGESQPLPPPSGALPSMLLGGSMSTRADATERVATIPRTHPFANSIAPGGSAITIPPRGRDYGRWYGLGAVALLGMAAAAGALLQSRGEHHAAARTEERGDLPVLAAEETRIVVEAPPPVLLAEVQPQADDGVAPLPAETAIAGDSERANDALRSSTRPARAEALGRAPASPARAGRETQRVAVGSVRLRESNAHASSSTPDRAAVIDAMSRIAADLRACVGDEHGVADVTLTVRSSGAVTHALVEGAFAGSEKGSCIARSLRAARFPAFAQPVLHIAYPLAL